MRILGIDFGSSSIKAVEMDSAFGRYDFHDYHEVSIHPEENPSDAVGRLLQNLPRKPDRIITSIPTKYTTFRNLQLPTRDKKAIQSGVGFELEDELPFPSEDFVFDYAIINQSKQGSSVHVAATLKQHLASFLGTWQSTEIDPDIISTEAWAYRTLLNKVLGNQGQNAPVLLVQIGNERTTLYLHWQGSPILVRDIAWGGRDLTLAVCQKYSIPIEQAESAKKDHGFVRSLAQPHTEAAPDQVEFASCLEMALDTLSRELRQVGLMAKSVTHHNISLIYLSGGTSLLPGLAPWIEEKLKIPTQPLLALSSATSSGVTYSDQTDARFLLAASLTLCLVGQQRTSCITFRKGDFSKSGKTREINFEALKKPLMAVGVVTFSLFLSLIVQSSVYRSRLQATDAQLEKSVRSFFGQLSSSALRTYMSNTSTLRASIKRELDKQRELSRLFGPNPKSPIDFLSSLSSTVSRDVVVDLIQFQVGSAAAEPFGNTDQTNSASLTFWVANPQMAERLTTLVGNRIANVQRGKMEEVNTPNGAGKKWKVTFSGKPSEDAYAK